MLGDDVQGAASVLALSSYKCEDRRNVFQIEVLPNLIVFALCVSSRALKGG